MKRIKLGLSIALLMSVLALNTHAQALVKRVNNTVGTPGYTSASVTISMFAVNTLTLTETSLGSHAFNTNNETYTYSPLTGFNTVQKFTVTVNGVTTAIEHTLPLTINQRETVTASELTVPALHGGYGIAITCTGVNQYTMTPTFFSAP